MIVNGHMFKIVIEALASWQSLQIDRHNGSFDAFEVLILHMPLHHRALLFHDKFQKNSNDV